MHRHARKTAVASSSSSCGRGRGRTRVQWGMERMDRGLLQSTHHLFYGRHENHVTVTLFPLFYPLWLSCHFYAGRGGLYFTHPLTIGIKLIPSSTSNLLIILPLCIPFVFVVPPCLIFIPWLYADSSIVLPVRSSPSIYMMLASRRLLKMQWKKITLGHLRCSVYWPTYSSELDWNVSTAVWSRTRCPQFQEQASKASRWMNQDCIPSIIGGHHYSYMLFNSRTF